MPSPPHPRLRNRHSLPRAVSNGAHPSDYAARELWTAIPCESLEYRGVVPTSESSTTRKVARPVNASAFSGSNPPKLTKPEINERIGLNASTQRALWYIEVLQFRLHPVRGKGRSHLNQPASTDS